MTNYDDPGTVQFRLGRLVRQLSVPEFSAPLGLYREEFKEENELNALTRHIHFSPSKCWHNLTPSAASYNPYRSKASVLPPSLRYPHTILAHTIIGSTTAQESSLALIGQMSPQGISSMLSMRMIEKRQITYPSQCRLAQSTDEEAYKDILDDVSTRTYRLSHYHSLVQFMRRLHMLTSLSASLDSSSSVFNNLTTLMLLYSRFVSTSTSHRQTHLANHPAMKMTYGLMNLYDRQSILLHSRTDYSPKLQFEEFIIQEKNP
ncbi:hypothetical protein GOBAR_AA17422 [Gossypium barbadense]|uniref:Uncharacterized protein n=1 Tax=Gossypium barbadense TaxID=3634 RepID=A0A2P5XIQ2_GOSBA|nr:hypothetical protein GOBAR_AA17422 [Gossypium barbadense]